MNKREKTLLSKNRLLISSFILMICLCMMSFPALAASKKKQAVRAYNEFLSQKMIPWGDNWAVDSVKFALIYVDNNSVPELLLAASGKYAVHPAGFIRLFTYKNGKVVDLDIRSDVFSYYKKTGIIVSTYGNGGDYRTYMKMSGTSCSPKLYYSSSLARQSKKEYYNAKKKAISKKSFNSKLKSLVKSKKKVTPKMLNNTAANRKKYLK